MVRVAVIDAYRGGRQLLTTPRAPWPSNQAETREKLSERPDVPADHAVRHFACEEGHMDRLQCPVRVTNECAHECFLRRFAS